MTTIKDVRSMLGVQGMELAVFVIVTIILIIMFIRMSLTLFKTLVRYRSKNVKSYPRDDYTYESIDDIKNRMI